MTSSADPGVVEVVPWCGQYLAVKMGRSDTCHRAPTGTVYVYHAHGFYHRGGYHDPWNPYDWTNYYNPLSPWYGHQALLAVGAC